MQSPGPPYQGPSVVSNDSYANRNYENHVLSTHGVSTNYLTYHSSDGSHESNYCEQSHYNTSSTPSATHYANNSSNSGHSYGQPVNHFNDMYTTCSPYAALPPAIRPPIPSSDLKYWNSDQMSQNSHNSYNQGIPPPPLVSRTGLRSPPTDRTGNSYGATAAAQSRSSSQSPQDWSRSPNVMHSPSTTPSPQTHRSPSHMPSRQYSPSHSSVANDSSSQPMVLKTDNGFGPQNQRTSQVNASNPLHSLQKMVMSDTEGAAVRNTYDNTLQSNGSVPFNTNATQKNYNNSDQNVTTDPDSPYPTYYNLDQNRLCTPPRPPPPPPNANPNLSYDNIPDTATSDGQLCGSDKELNKCDKNDIKCNNHNIDNNNSSNDLMLIGEDDSKGTLRQMANKSNDTLNAGVVVNGENQTLKKEMNTTKSDCIVADEPPALCKRSSSQESIQSSDSEKNHSNYGDTRAHQNWQMGNHYYSNQSDKNAWPQWPQNSGHPSSVPQTSDYMSDGRHVVPNSGPHPDYHTQQPSDGTRRCGSGSWGASTPSSQNSSSQRDFASPNNMRQTSTTKKRGRPFGSKNRRNSDDTNSETNTSDASNSTKKKKKAVATEEIGINTNVTLDPHGFDELAVVNPLKQVSKRKKTVGPFIRLEKGKGKVSTVYSIVNTSAKPEDEKDVKNKSLSGKLEPLKPMRRPSLLVSSKKVVSTLSPQYDFNTRDKTWVCALCHKGPHYKGLGDLYGPYYISKEDKTKTQSSASTATTSQPLAHSSRSASIDDVIDSVASNEPTPQESERKRGRRRKSEATEDTATAHNAVIPHRGRPPKSRIETPKPVISSPNHSDSSTNTEVWVHEDCIVWSSGVYLIGHRVRHLEEVISESNESFCTKCKLSGATLGCLQKSCNTSQFHYLCAKEKGCELDDENFSLLCPKHKKKAKTSSSAGETSAAMT
ncbi:unnamed protein product [Medioppia subpectinata]|uniref:PHD-type domain-containing protein n=1 Tax=Medioppia subpectinata TaxID=1979941 RepID=A0A7R9KJS6_9ACAR|nr:unnamed protein product [Medioppia subpectinata]CAG2103662.1 unnamed protein product [Medioppia subpectinata]